MALRHARNRGFVSPQRVAMLADAADVPCSSQPSMMPGVRTPCFDAGQCSTTSVGVSSHPSTSQSSLIPNVRTALRQARSRGPNFVSPHSAVPLNEVPAPSSESLSSFMGDARRTLRRDLTMDNSIKKLKNLQLQSWMIYGWEGPFGEGSQQFLT